MRLIKAVAPDQTGIVWPQTLSTPETTTGLPLQPQIRVMALLPEGNGTENIGSCHTGT
jgi:hypothetical protein